MLMSNQQAGVCIFVLGVLFLIVTLIVMLWDENRIKKYTEQIQGTVAGHKWVNTENMSYSCAIVTYFVDGKEYQCMQRYRAVFYNSVKHAKCDWELDEKYRLHSYVTRKCESHVNPTED